MKRSLSVFILSALLGTAFGPDAAKAAYPEQPITLVVPFAAGGGVDGVARLIGKAMSEDLGQPIVVENRPGAGGQVGTSQVALRAEPDGYTVLIASPGAITAGPALFPSLKYDPKRDLAAVGQAVTIPNVVVAHPSFPATNVKELVEIAKSGKVQVNYGSGGVGTSQHLAGELLAYNLGIPMRHVPYKGTAPAVVDTISGQVQMTFADPSAMVHVREGRLRAIGITTGKRSRALPDLPTLAEQGATGYDASNWYGFLVPKTTPQEVIDRLNKAVNYALGRPEVVQALLNMGMDPTPTSPAEFQAFLDADFARWSELVKALGLKPE